MTAYRDDGEALEARRAALAREVDAKRRELDETDRQVAGAKARAMLPVLDNITIASPCAQPWEGMTGDARVRHCAACDQRIYDLGELTRAEAQALIVEREGRLCVRYFQRTDGTILLKDCSIGVQRKRRRRLATAGAAALLVGAAGGVMLYPSHHDPARAPAVPSIGSDQPAAAPSSCTDDDPDGRHFVGRLDAQLDSTAAELDSGNRLLEQALTQAGAERAQARSERAAAHARAQAAIAAAQAAAESAAQAERARAEAAHGFEAARARTRALEEQLRQRPAGEPTP